MFTNKNRTTVVSHWNDSNSKFSLQQQILTKVVIADIKWLKGKFKLELLSV